MNIDDQLRRAGNRLNTELDLVPVPEAPQHNGGKLRVLAIAAVVTVTVGGAALWLAGGSDREPVAPAGSTTTSSTPSTTLATVQPDKEPQPPVTDSVTFPPSGEEAWSKVDAERHVTNFLAALAAGAYEQAAWPAENNGVEIEGQAQSEAPADALERLCGEGACAGPYAVDADGPGLIDPDSGQASSTVTVTHRDSGGQAAVRLVTFEGQLLIADLPPLVPSAGGATLVELLFGGDFPGRVVVARLDAFEIWENGQPEWVTNWWADDAYQVEGDVVASSQVVAGLREPQTEYEWECPRLMVRDGEVLVLEWCYADGRRIFEVTSGDPRPNPISFEEQFDGEFQWFAERGGTVIAGVGDAEGNLISLSNSQGIDLLGDDYAGLPVLSADGASVAYVDHRDPAAWSHFWSPVVVVKNTSTGAELGRWTLDNPVLRLEFAESWLVAGEADPAVLGGGISEQIALDAINIESGDVNRVATPTRIFLPAEGGSQVTGTTFGPYDTAAEIRPELISVQPSRVQVGDSVSVFFPDERIRGIHFVLESRRGDEWKLEYHLISDWGDGREPQSYRAVSMQAIATEDIGISGGGPDVIFIPIDVAEGEYRVCTGNSRPNICARLTIDAAV